MKRAIVYAAFGGALFAWALALAISLGNARTSAAEIRAGMTPQAVRVAARRRFFGGWILALLTSLAIAGGGAALAASRWVPERSDGASDERLRAFLADAAHELRTPLAIAVGYTGILKRGGTSDRELTDRIVGDIAAEHERLQRLVDRILQLARLDAIGKPDIASCDAVAVAREAIDLVRPLDPARQIDLHAPDRANAAIGQDDLRDALRNLLDNAMRYAPGSPIVLSVAADGDVTVRVSDRGPGMDEFTAAHAFDRFFRGADRGEIPGSGLGLSIVRRIVERAGGRVALDSAPGRGTAIELRLPRSRSSPAV
jgi:two-component system OmpR family sensor kinase